MADIDILEEMDNKLLEEIDDEQDKDDFDGHRCIENAIEWLNGEKEVSVTLSQRKYINKIKKLALKDENVRIIAENPDGSIFVKMPIGYIKISKPKEMSEENKEALRQRVSLMRENKQGIFNR